MGVHDWTGEWVTDTFVVDGLGVWRVGGVTSDVAE